MKKLQIQTLIALVAICVGAQTAYASSTQIRSRIATVRIIVIDEHGTITQIYRNSNQQIPPDVRRILPEGPRAPYTADIAQQYTMIASSLARDSIGKVYDRPKLPSLIETLYAML